MALGEVLSTGGLFLLVIPGFITAYFGWKIHETLVALVGFVVGIVTGVVVAAAFLFGQPGAAASDNVGLFALVIIILFGIGGAEFFKAMERLAVALPGFLLGALVGAWASHGSIGDIFTPIPVIFGLAMGLLVWWGYVAAIVLYTAFFGAFFVSFGLLVMNGEWYGLTQTSRIFSGLFWLIFLTGAAVQAGVVAKFTQVSETDSEAVSEHSVLDMLTATRERASGGPAYKDMLAGTAEDSLLACPKCEAACMRSDAFCPGCGTAVRHCESCDAIALADWTFCRECGESIT